MISSVKLNYMPMSGILEILSSQTVYRYIRVGSNHAHLWLKENVSPKNVHLAVYHSTCDTQNGNRPINQSGQEELGRDISNGYRT